MNIKTLVLDQYDMVDAGVTPKGEMEKVAAHYHDSFYSHEDMRRGKDTDFAIVVLSKTGSLVRKFFLNSLSNTQMAKLAFLDNHDKLPIAMQRHAAAGIAKACQRYAVVVPDEISKLASEYPDYKSPYYTITREDERSHYLSMEKVASHKCYAINEDLTGAPFLSVPIDTERELREAMRKLEKEASIMAFGYAVQMAGNIIKRASDVGVAIPDDHVSRRILGTEFSEVFESQMAKRAAMAGNDRFKNAYHELVKTASASDPRAVATAVDKLDRLSRLDFRWSKELLPPLDAVISHVTEPMRKKAEEIVAMGGIDYPVDTVRSTVNSKSDVMRKYIGASNVARLEQDPKAGFDELPAAHKQLVLALMKGDV